MWTYWWEVRSEYWSQKWSTTVLVSHRARPLALYVCSLYINELPDVCPPPVSCQMYADDTVLYLHSKNMKTAAHEPSDAMANIANRLTSSCSKFYMQDVKTLDKKSNAYHHCNILQWKYDFLNWENIIKFAGIILVFHEIFHGLAPSPLVSS